MRLNSKGQVTIPSDVRRRHRLRPGDEIEVVEIGDTLQILRSKTAPTRGQRAVERMRASADTSMSTDELMSLLRDD